MRIRSAPFPEVSVPPVTVRVPVEAVVVNRPPDAIVLLPLIVSVVAGPVNRKLLMVNPAGAVTVAAMLLFSVATHVAAPPPELYPAAGRAVITPAVAVAQ